MAQKTDKEKKLIKNSRRQKRTIIALSIALALAGTTAIVAPTIISVLNKGNTPTPASYCTVTFNGNGKITFKGGATTSEVVVEKDTEIGKISFPQTESIAEGYVFGGWYYDAACTKKVSSDEKIDTSIPLYAGCIEKNKKITLSFSVDATAGEKLVGQSSVEVLKTATWGDLKNNMPSASKEGNYSFSSWTYADGSEIKDTDTFSEATTLKPYFSRVPYATLNVNLVDGQELSQGSLTTTIYRNSDYTWPKWKDVAGNYMGTYCAMFEGCTKLVNAPKMDVTAISDSGTYGDMEMWWMFHNCKALEVGPAIKIADFTNVNHDWGYSVFSYQKAGSCQQMFLGCTSLKSIDLTAIKNLGSYDLKQMFYGCSALKVNNSSGTLFMNLTYNSSTAVDGMFTNTGGSFKSNPAKNTNYYLS